MPASPYSSAPGLSSSSTPELSPPTQPYTLGPRRRSSASSFSSVLEPLPEGADWDASRAGSGTASPPAKVGDWVLDVSDTEAKREAWRASERVILVLGDYTAAALHPILQNDLFDNTLLVLGSLRPRPPIPPRTSRPALHHLPHPTWAHSTVQDLVEGALPAIKAFRKKHSRSRSRVTSFFSRSSALTSTSNRGPSAGAAPVFDCVISFLSPALRFDPRQALPRLLREVVMSTTAVLACLPSGSSASLKTKADPAPLTLVQVLPLSYPAALPTVVQQYLASLLPTLARHQRLAPLVLAQPLFSADKVAGSYAGADISAPEAVLLGLLAHAPGEGQAQTFLPSWSCVLQGLDRVGSAVAPVGGQSASMDRRGSDNSIASTLSSNDAGPMTPRTSSESFERTLRNPTTARTPDPSSKAKRQTLHLPAQPSRLSHVQTYADQPDSPGTPIMPQTQMQTLGEPEVQALSPPSAFEAYAELGAATPSVRGKRGSVFGWMRKG